MALAYSGGMQKSRIQQNIDKARDKGARILEQEIIYKYKIHNQNDDKFIKYIRVVYCV